MSESIEVLVRFAPLLSPLILLVGATIAFFSYRNARRVSNNSALMHVYDKLGEHNKEMRSDEKRKLVVSIFHSQDIDDLQEEISNMERKNNYYDLFWSTRIVHMSHLNLIFQFWIFLEEMNIRLGKNFRS